MALQARPDPQPVSCRSDDDGDHRRRDQDRREARPRPTRRSTASTCTRPSASRRRPTPTSTIEVAETSVAIAQASRYSQTCRVFAPMYRQVTIVGPERQNRSAGPDRVPGRAGGVERLSRALQRRPGCRPHRPFAGHVRPAPAHLAAHRRRRVGAQVASSRRSCSAAMSSFPPGRRRRRLQEPPRVRSARSQIGCVIAYSAFDQPPPAASLFGRARQPDRQVLCTNPGRARRRPRTPRPVLPHAPRGLVRRGQPRGATTPWVSYPDLFVGECKSEGGASWLQVTDVAHAGRRSPQAPGLTRTDVGTAPLRRQHRARQPHRDREIRGRRVRRSQLRGRALGRSTGKLSCGRFCRRSRWTSNEKRESQCNKAQSSSSMQKRVTASSRVSKVMTSSFTSPASRATATSRLDEGQRVRVRNVVRSQGRRSPERPSDLNFALPVFEGPPGKPGGSCVQAGCTLGMSFFFAGQIVRRPGPPRSVVWTWMARPAESFQPMLVAAPTDEGSPQHLAISKAQLCLRSSLADRSRRSSKRRLSPRFCSTCSSYASDRVPRCSRYSRGRTAPWCVDC